MTSTRTERSLVALLPMRLLKKVNLKGILVGNVICFMDDDEVLKRSKENETISASVEGSRIESADGIRVGTVIVVPDVRPGRRLVSIASVTTDAFTDALDAYSSSDSNRANKGLHRGNSFRQVSVPDILVQFCKATSLASHAATAGDDIAWSQVSMTMAIRAKRVWSKVGMMLDTVLGLVALAILFKYWGVLANLVDEQLAFEDRTLKERVEFVMSKHAPLGFKLNPQADFVLGNLVILVVDAWQNLVSYPALFGKGFVALGFMLAAILNRQIGLSVLFAVAFDGFALLSVHVGVLHRVISRILRFQLGLTSSLALLMRGKKRNMLRHRVDTLKTDSAQLMLGTMAIFFFTFTLQTTLAYHILVLAVWALVFFIQSTLFFICVILRTLPFDEIFVAILDRNAQIEGAQNPRGFYMVYDEKIGFWRLVVVPTAVGDVVGSWITLLGRYWSGAWSRRWGSQKVFQNVLFGHELPTVPPPDFV